MHDSRMSTLLGTLLNDRYRLEARIGTGGMSSVYRALDTTLERQVAIKLMNREIVSDSDQLERFRREARAVAQLNHAHVVGVTSNPTIFAEAQQEGDIAHTAAALPALAVVAARFAHRLQTLQVEY